MHFEFWEGTEADYEEKEQIVRAAVDGKCRYWWPREEVGKLLRPWRKHYVRQLHSEIALLHRLATFTRAGGGGFLRAGEGEKVQAAPY